MKKEREKIFEKLESERRKMGKEFEKLQELTEKKGFHQTEMIPEWFGWAIIYRLGDFIFKKIFVQFLIAVQGGQVVDRSYD